MIIIPGLSRTLQYFPGSSWKFLEIPLEGKGREGKSLLLS